MNNSVISIKNMSKSYKDKKVLDGLNWDIKKGDIVALLGKNGAGKSTLLETIMNLRENQSESLQIWGQSWKNLPQDQRDKIGFVAQDIAGFEWMRVHEFLNYLGSFFSHWDKTYCEDLVSRWEIDPKQKVAELSGGQTQILHVIQAISIKPELLILDEPVAHLDPNMRRKFISELINLCCDNETTVIFSSHIISDLERVANKVSLLKDGKIQMNYDIEELKSNIAHLKISSDKPLEQSEYFKGLKSWHAYVGGATAKLIFPMQQSIKDYIANSPYAIEATPISLEDWYLEVSNEFY
ncbi:MAG: ABC transporter ATP-binding protein [Marinicellaceae bacterium]